MGDLKPQHSTQNEQGWLLKWTNYIKGYQRRWFVLSGGVLSYYRAEPTGRGGPKISARRKRRAGPASENPADTSQLCRGAISLRAALIHTLDSCTFVISNDGTQTFHIKAANEVERQRWVTALELAKSNAKQTTGSEEEEEIYRSNDKQKGERTSMMKDLTEKLEKLQKCCDRIIKRGQTLTWSINDLESLEPTNSIGQMNPDVAAKIKAASESAALFRATAITMVENSNSFLQLAQQLEPKWKKTLQYECDQRVRLEKMVEQLALQHSHLEEAAQHALPSSTPPTGSHRSSHAVTNTSPSEDEEDNVEFYDAQESDTFTLNLPSITTGNLRERSRNDSQGSDDGSSSEGDQAPMSSNDPSRADSFHVVTDNTASTRTPRTTELDKPPVWPVNNGRNDSGMIVSKRKRRTRVPEKPNYPLNLWSIMKNCIGKELSKIPMPVNFSEPLSMLQRLTEDYEYAEILDRAAECTESCEQMAYVAAFTVSSYSTTADRTGKPFNPLLGETYECDRTEDLGWRAISEQVSHHPPMLAQFCEGRAWRCWQEFTMASKFRGKYIQVIPLGTAHLEFNSNSHHYTWRKVTTTVHNIIVGKLWVDQSGDMDIINHTDGTKCHLKYIPYSYFSRDNQRKVKGVVMNANKEVKWVIQGTWDAKIEIAPVISTSGSPDNPVYKTGPYTLAWKRRLPPSDCEKYYSFTELASQLNEPEEGVAITDSRLRPDQRLMENGFWDEANAEKLRLEEKQRTVRRSRESEAEKSAVQGSSYCNYEPVWFTKQEDKYTDSLCHMYNREYWACKSKGDWSRCPNIF